MCVYVCVPALLNAAHFCLLWAQFDWQVNAGSTCPLSVEPVNLTVHSLSDIPSLLFFLCISLFPGGNVLWVVVTSDICSGGKGLLSPYILFFLFDFNPSHAALVKSVLLICHKIDTHWFLSSFPTSSLDTCDINVCYYFLRVTYVLQSEKSNQTFFLFLCSCLHVLVLVCCHVHYCSKVWHRWDF